MEVDTILQKLGGYERYQLLVYFALGFVYLRGAWHVFGIVFIGAGIEHKCSVPQSVSTNQTDEHLIAGSCQLTVSNLSSGFNQTLPCKYGWNYSSEFESTIVSEWDLVCDNDYMVELSTTIYMIGSAIGAIALTPLADQLGRKFTMLSSLFLQAAIGFGVAFVQNVILFMVLRFFVGFLNMGIALSAYILMTEVFPASHRTRPAVAIQFFWALGLMTLALFGYLVRDWHHLQMLISLPSLLTVSYFWILPESLPWLLAKTKWDKAKSVIRWAAKLNKKTLCADSLLSEVKEAQNNRLLPNGDHSKVANNVYESTETSQCNETTKALPPQENGRPSKKVHTALDLFRSPKMRLYAIVMWYLFFVNSLSYFGISFSTPILHGNPFLNLFLMGVAEIPAYIICLVAISWIGRRWLVFVFLLTCGVTNILAIVLPDQTEDGTSLFPLKITLIAIGKFGITGSYTMVYLYSAEIFPTVVRNQAVGISSFFENIGSISAPFIVYGAKTIHQLPLVVFGVLTVVGGGLVLLLPETHQRPLPETIEEIESWGKKVPNRTASIL